MEDEDVKARRRQAICIQIIDILILSPNGILLGNLKREIERLSSAGPPSYRRSMIGEVVLAMEKKKFVGIEEYLENLDHMHIKFHPEIQAALDAGAFKTGRQLMHPVVEEEVLLKIFLDDDYWR